MKGRILLANELSRSHPAAWCMQRLADGRTLTTFVRHHSHESVCSSCAYVGSRKKEKFCAGLTRALLIPHAPLDCNEL